MVTEMAPTFRANLTAPLIAQAKGRSTSGVQDVIGFMDAYDLTKDDMESILGKIFFVFEVQEATVHSKRAPECEYC